MRSSESPPPNPRPRHVGRPDSPCNPALGGVTDYAGRSISGFHMQARIAGNGHVQLRMAMTGAILVYGRLAQTLAAESIRGKRMVFTTDVRLPKSSRQHDLGLDSCLFSEDDGRSFMGVARVTCTSICLYDRELLISISHYFQGRVCGR